MKQYQVYVIDSQFRITVEQTTDPPTPEEKQKEDCVFYNAELACDFLDDALESIGESIRTSKRKLVSAHIKKSN